MKESVKALFERQGKIFEDFYRHGRLAARWENLYLLGSQPGLDLSEDDLDAIWATFCEEVRVRVNRELAKNGRRQLNMLFLAGEQCFGFRVVFHGSTNRGATALVNVWLPVGNDGPLTLRSVNIQKGRQPGRQLCNGQPSGNMIGALFGDRPL